MTIRLAHLRKADLNLLVYLVVLMEEQGISRAARRLGLTQPSVSRALQRLRELFQDELLTRTAEGYKPTPRGQSLLNEAAVILPQIERLITGVIFDPTRDKTVFHICASDNATQLYGPVLCRDISDWKISFTFQPWRDDRFEELERNRLDLVLDAKMDLAPDHMHSECLFEDEFVCVVAKDSPLPEHLSLDLYLAQQHIGVNVLHGRQTLPELALRAEGQRRKCPVTVPYFTVALKLVERTTYVVTAPRRLAQAIADQRKTRLLLAPKVMTPFSYMMYWHPRQERDPRHQWLRERIRVATPQIAPLQS